MALAPLVARPSWPAASVVPEPQRAPTANDWAARFPEIERLYVHERRKLRFVMRYMEKEHGFKASEQMYKKRFAKWGFQKNFRRSLAPVPTLATKDASKKLPRRKHNATGELGRMPFSLQLAKHDRLMVKFLSSVRKWSVAFFESMRPGHGSFEFPQQLPLKDQPPPEKTKETHFTLKLVGDLLDRGHGALAGRIARKAFLLVEDLLTLDGPALIWNLLEIMYHMVVLRHEHLFQILLGHLIALTDGRISKIHPLWAVLHDLRALVASLVRQTHTPGSSASKLDSTSSPSPSIGGNVTTTTPHAWLFSCTISSVLQEAWILNAKIVFDHFDPGFIQLYCHMDWESGSIGLPSNITRLVKQWLTHFDAQHMPCALANVYYNQEVILQNAIEEDRMLQRLLGPRMDASPPQDYEMLRTSSLAILWELGDSMLSKGEALKTDTDTALRLVPAMIKAKILEKPFCANVEGPRAAGGGAIQVSRSQAGILALVVRALTDFNAEHSGERITALPAAVERIRSIVALREYASGETDPQVMREMWLLEDALAAAGERTKAQEVGQSVIRRLEKYTQDIPLDSV